MGLSRPTEHGVQLPTAAEVGKKARFLPRGVAPEVDRTLRRQE